MHRKRGITRPRQASGVVANDQYGREVSTRPIAPLFVIAPPFCPALIIFLLPNPKNASLDPFLPTFIYITYHYTAHTEDVSLSLACWRGGASRWPPLLLSCLPLGYPCRLVLLLVLQEARLGNRKPPVNAMYQQRHEHRPRQDGEGMVVPFQYHHHHHYHNLSKRRRRRILLPLYWRAKMKRYGLSFSRRGHGKSQALN